MKIDIIELVKILISVFSFSVSIIAICISTNNSKRGAKTKKHELSSAEKERVIAWFGDTVETLIYFQHMVAHGERYKKSELAHLSALIERGRYYFPNVKKVNIQSEHKMSTFKGYRQAVLTFLILSYNILIRDDIAENSSEYAGDLYTLQKAFTSGVLDIIKPEAHIKSLEEQTGMKMDSNMTFVDFLSKYSETHYHNYTNLKRIFDNHKEDDMAEALLKAGKK